VHEVFFASGTPVEEQYALERQFFDRVALTNGTQKTTYSNRFDDVNEAFLPHFVKMADRPIRIMDVGASSGLSTLEWYAQLARSGIDCEIIGSDLTIYVTLATFRFTAKVAALLDRNGDIIHFDLFNVGWMRQPYRKLLRPNTLRTLAVRALFRAARMFDGKPSPDTEKTLSSKGWLLEYQSIALLSRGLIQNDKVRMIEDDLLAENNIELCRAFNVIRAANILHAVYFSVDLIERMLATLKRRLRDGGLLIIVRTDANKRNHASIFRLTGDQFLVIDRFGNGCEIEHIISGH
jgi:hypothetical protein